MVAAVVTDRVVGQTSSGVDVVVVVDGGDDLWRSEWCNVKYLC